jgi:HD-GYP domain-containing protein (c-di-GMP phosphodiesterase class II)
METNPADALSVMAGEPNFEDQELLADTFARVRLRLSPRARLTEALVGVGFAAAVAGVWVIRPPHAFALLPAGASLLVLGLATRVRFDTPFGFTVPLQLGFVPLLFAMPLALVPIAVVVTLITAGLPDVLAGRTPPSRLLMTIGNSWFALGPVAVFALAHTQPGNASAGLLLGALGAQFTVDFIVSAARDLAERSATLVAQLRETWVYAVDAALSGIALVVAEDVHAAPLATLAPVPLLGLLAMFARERRQRLEGVLELSDAYRGTAQVLGDVIAADDGYTGEHCKSVVALALEVGDQFPLSTGQRRNLEFGALLHDVGKIAIPKDIINKPGKLDPQEWTIIKTHTLEGQKMLDHIGGFMRHIGVVVRSHHERWDGDGYPDGLVREAIPLEARIITCCDSWNAMRTDRPYRKALSHELACAELEANAGHQFDPKVVRAFLNVVQPTAEPNPAVSTAAKVLQERDQAKQGFRHEPPLARLTQMQRRSTSQRGRSSRNDDIRTDAN